MLWKRALTLDHHLVTGHQYLLAVAGLCVLEDGGSRLGCCSVGHGQSLQALDSICTVVSQLNGPTLCDRNCVFGEKEKEIIRSYQCPFLMWHNASPSPPNQLSPTVLATASLVDGCGHGNRGDWGRGGGSRWILLSFFLLDARDSWGVGRKVV